MISDTPPALSRRELLRLGAVGVASTIFGSRAHAHPSINAGPQAAPPSAKAVTAGPKHHFFGYYDKFPWDKTGRYLLAHDVDFIGRQPKPDEPAVLGRVDLADGNRFLPFAKTEAWCWQQGTMLEWMPNAADRVVRYNARDGDRFVTVLHDFAADKSRTLSRPIYAVSSDGLVGVSINFARLNAMRPGYGYAGLADPWAGQAAPSEDGLWRVDTATGDAKLIRSLADLAAHKPRADFRGDGVAHTAYHVQFNPAGSRFIFLHRWGQPNGKWLTRLFTLDAAGRDLRLLADHGMTSHFDWFDDSTILAWARDAAGRNRFFLIPDVDGSGDKPDSWKTLGETVMPQDGHCSYSPDRKWLLNDTYPQKDRCRELFLYRLADGKRFELGRYHSPRELDGPWRCDLHPRWSRDGRQVCFDSAHEATRQMYVIDVSAIVRQA